MAGRFFYFLILVLVLLFNFQANAEKFNTGELIVKSGGKGALSEDEGYLFLTFYSETDISRLTIDGEGIGNKIRFNDVEKGNNYALIKLKAGSYHWEFINIYVGIGSVRYRLTKDEFPFEVKPGVVNYPGSWRFNMKWTTNFRTIMKLENFNRLSFAMQHFKKHYQNLVGDVVFQYQGEVDDPYPNFLNATTQAHVDAGGEVPDIYYAHENKASLPIEFITKETPTQAVEQKYPQIKKYFQFDQQTINGVSPGGEFMLFKSKFEDVITIGLIGVTNYETYLLYQQKLPPNTQVSELEWIDANSFFLTLSNKDLNRSYVAHLDFNDQTKTINAKFVKFRVGGYVLDGLPDTENEMLFVVVDDQFRSRGKNNLFKLKVDDEQSIEKSFRKVYPQTKKLKNVIDWLVDDAGQVRAAITVEYDKKAEETLFDYWFLANQENSQWERIKSGVSMKHSFWLLHLSSDEQHFLVLTNEFGDKNAIHKYSTKDGSHQGLYYEDPNHDIEQLIMDESTGEVSGYYFIKNGLPQAHYFKQLDEKFALTKKLNPDMKLFQVKHIPTKNRMLLFGLTTNSKGAWYMLDTETTLGVKIFDINPEYEKLDKGEHHLIKTIAEDGVELEGYLIMPIIDNDAKAPLIVMPHGGPIGVQDFAHNNEMQHYLAKQGFATLKVNYRGSSGYGKAFQELGKQQWGEKIEQDIHTMTTKVIKDYQVNHEKICAMGGSYGGYSALMLTYLYPDTYQCGISFAGVMDLPLLFSARDLSNDPELMQVFKDIVGDPLTEMEKLKQKSPLYLLNEMTKPILLFHGLKDSRVRVEHALRMQQLMSIYDINQPVVLFEDEGHSYSQNNTAILYLAKSIEFIKKHLEL